MLPRVGGRNLVSRLKNVVLPAPLGPISAWMSPRRTFRSTLLTATNPLNSLVSPLVSRLVSAGKFFLRRGHAGQAVPAPSRPLWWEACCAAERGEALSPRRSSCRKADFFGGFGP